MKLCDCGLEWGHDESCTAAKRLAKLVEFVRLVADAPEAGLPILPLCAQALLSELGLPRVAAPSGGVPTAPEDQ